MTAPDIRGNVKFLLHRGRRPYMALRTMPIAAAVVGNGGVAARRVRAARNMPAKGRRAAALDRAHHLHLRMGEMAAHGTTPCGTVIAENIRNFQSGALHDGARLLRRARDPCFHPPCPAYQPTVSSGATDHDLHFSPAGTNVLLG